MTFRILFTIVLLFSYLKSQTRYLDEVFDEVIKTEDIVYGNAPDLPFIFLFEWNTVDIDLTMDVYEPAGDTISNRPVIIFIHSGAFFTGSNESDVLVSLSNTSAKMGYVAISMTYRLGLNVFSSYSGERAVYRGVQDASAVIRYLREHHIDFGIDYDNIFIWGSSAGSFIGLHLAFTEDAERPLSTFGGEGDPDLGCIDCEGNDYEHESKPTAVISCWGAIGDLNWIGQNNNIPSIMFHGTSDAVVPFNSGYPFTIDIFLPFVYGSNLIHNRLNELNIENVLYAEEGLLHEYWGTSNGSWDGGPNDYFDLIKSDSYSFLFNLIYPYQVGDVNTDGLINHLDFANMLSFILDDNIPSSNLYYSDLNYDSLVDIFDLLFLSQIIN
ncbi:MAG: hypothetical protein CMG55_02395 [Candidatus Marinimicrobia bacterium]|nr:hypothetical protein [Candidatus Neomarinimicrobiota bacterium]|tara:strand:+ start:158 stop:1306 length:1149 start_codon:yes stop_codon:yes gene_type:complete